MTDKDLITEVTFQDPPPMRVVKYDWTAIAKRLKRRPGEWALIYEVDSSGYAVAIRSNKVTALKREHGFESRTANNTTGPNRTCSLWLRYNPDNDTRKAGK